MRFNLTVAAIFLAAMIFSVIETVGDTRQRIHNQTTASVETAEFLIQSQITQLQLQWGQADTLPTDAQLVDLFRVDLYNLRHLDVELLNAEGELLSENHPPITAEEMAGLPEWYVSLIRPFLDKLVIEKPIDIADVNLGKIVIQHDIDSEIAQIWSDSMQVLFPLVVAFFVVSLLTSWLASRWLGPLGDLLIRYRRNKADHEHEPGTTTLSKLRMPFLRGVRDEFQSLQTQLDNYNQQLSEFNEKLLFMQEDERRRVSAELHDELGQYLTAMQFDVMAIGNARDLEQAKTNARAIDEMSRQMTAIVRDMLTRLRPPSLDEVGLEGSLQDLVTAWQSRYPQHHADVYLRLPDTPLNDAIQLTVYRMVQEALTNISRYAGDAVHVIIDIHSHSGKLNIVIRDNGKGFEPQNRPRGYGLDAMQERVQAVQGYLQIESTPGAGVSLVAEIPLNNNENEEAKS